MSNKMKSIGMRSLHLLCDILVFMVEKSVKFQLRVDRKVIKRYFQIETPLYRLWHRNHVKYMQRKLDMAHGNFRIAKSYKMP